MDSSEMVAEIYLCLLFISGNCPIEIACEFAQDISRYSNLVGYKGFATYRTRVIRQDYPTLDACSKGTGITSRELVILSTMIHM